MKNNKIGLGTAAIGRPLYINLKTEKPEQEFSLPEFIKHGTDVLENAYKNGIRFFDTSPGYGIAEKILLDWLQTKNDPEIEVSTKWGYTYVADFNPNALVHEIKEHSLNKLNEQWKTSQQLLPYLKIYQIHSATFETGVLENQVILERLYELKNTHNLKIGLTTTGANQTEVLKAALKIKIDNEFLFDSFQCTFNIFDQSILEFKDDLDNKSLIIKEALANGRVFPNESFPFYQKAYQFLTDLSNKYKVGIDAIALSFCMESFPNAMVLSGANQSNHLESNLNANQISLTKSELEKLKSFKVSAKDYWTERKALKWN